MFKTSEKPLNPGNIRCAHASKERSHVTTCDFIEKNGNRPECPSKIEYGSGICGADPKTKETLGKKE